VQNALLAMQEFPAVSRKHCKTLIMGKFTTEKKLNTNMEKVPFEFDVIFRKGNKVHTETFRLASYNDARVAINEGILTKNENGYYQYLDWKPLNGGANIDGGLKNVIKFTRDEKYIYAHTQEKIFSLPRYLESKIKNYNVILFGNRVGTSPDKDIKNNN
jgi:hypothetical protein